ncbi:ABC transporter ATP-binding protein [Ferruginivarius sediminum]|uniref:Quaternary amine transport ATP-binding protein n=1 Tax=Ferruginivarius sediminum TaxID=2661937 RepID=A0A369T8T2_9PROT|nr:ABC transporter ATP-binding protein [Ferruginivarius sediminum]RDD61302.1 ATP-binding cassette domain-containing protein [Ferruginivarius sediminum]
MIRVEDLQKTFQTERGEVRAVQDVNFEVPEGELCILLGPSGCGKTTTLKMVNRLIPRTSGKIYINERDTDEYDIVELRRHIGYVIQQIGLFPNMTVEENICVVPKMLGWSKKQQHERAADLVNMVALDQSVLSRYPKELSGGQQQRVGLCRGLAGDPPVLLMDEPFGAIDPINREIIQDEFLKMQADLKKTILFVSHDIDEAVKMGDKIAIFRDGKLVQFGTPDNLLAHPVNDFVADFVGGDRELKRMRLIKISEALKREVPTVSATDTLDTAAKKVEQAGANHIVVLDDDGRPEGVLTQGDLDSKGSCGDSAHPLRTTVQSIKDLRTAVSRMFTYNTDWLAVVDDDGKFVGEISYRSITEMLHASRKRGEKKGAA